MRRIPSVLVASVLAIAGCGGRAAEAKKDTTNMNTPQQSARKAQVRDLLKAIETGESGPVGVINPDKYIQHNLGAADGLA